MKTKTHFPSFAEVYERLRPRMEELEILRKKLLRKEQLLVLLTFMGIILGGAGWILYIIEYPIHLGIMVNMFLFGIIMFSIGVGVRNKAIETYKLLLENEIVEGVVQGIDPTFTFKHDYHIERSTFMKTKIFPHSKVDFYNGENLIIGKIGETDFRLCELEVEQRNADSYIPDLPVFNGIFLEADFHKHFKGRTLVLPRYKTVVFPKFLSRFNALGKESITMEDPYFNEKFVVYSSDPVEARYILSPLMMNDLKKVSARFKRGICISFYQGEMFVAVDWQRDFLYPFWGVEATDKDPIKSYYKDLILFLKLIDDLNLNTRIWSKRP